MQVTITYDPDTETLSVDPTAYAGTTADNDTSELIIEGLVGDLVDWTVDLVFPIVSFSSSCNSFYPMARLDQTRIYSLPNALLSLCRDGILPVQLRLTKDDKIKWSRNTVRIDVSKIVDAVGSIGDAFPLQAYLKGDTASWSRSIVYEEGAIVERDGYLYRSTDSNNLGNDPETPESTWWSPIDVAAPYYSGLFGDGEQTAIDVRHKLNTEELAWSVHLDGSYTEDVIVTVIDADNVRFSFDHAPSYNSVHVVIMPAFRVVGHGIRIKGPLTVEGDITNMGGAHIIYTDEMHTKKAMIYLREDATVGLLPEELSGLRFVRYDGVHDGVLAVDSHGTAYVGDEGDLQPIATRADADEMTDDLPVVWDSIGSKMVTRELVAGDIPDLDAGKIISGTIADERIPSGITRDTELTAHTSRTDNPHSVTKSQVDLGNVDNTSDVNKPISAATQTALNAKQDTITGGATTIASANLTSSRALISNSSGKVVVSPVTATELGYVDGVTSPIQSQIDTKVTKTGAESIGGVKTFTDNVNVGLVGTPKQLSLVGDLNIQGNITQNGTAYEVHAEQIHTKDDKIIMRDGATAGLLAGDSSGFTFKKYDGTNDGELSVDSSGIARVGDVGDLQPLATRDESEAMGDGLPVVWDADNLKMITKALAPGDIPELDASKITSGTLADARIPTTIARSAEVTAHTGNTGNPHAVTKAQVGLGAYPTSPADIGISTATQTALNAKQDKLTFDTAPTAGSVNPVTSGGIKTALDTKQSNLTFDTAPTASSTNPVTSDGIKVALDTKEPTITGGATTITSANLTGSRALISTSGGKVSTSGTTSTELGYVSGVTSAIQTQLNGKQATLSFDSTPIDSSTNPVTSGGVKTAIDTKQDKLTFDTSPITGSANPVTSGGIYNALTAIGLGGVLSTKLFANEGVMIESGVERGFDVKRTDITYDETTSSFFRQDRVYDKDNKEVGGLYTGCLNFLGQKVTVSAIHASTYKDDDDGTQVRASLTVNADSLGNCWAEVPMQENPKVKDAVNKGYLDGRLSTKQDKLTFDSAPTAGSANPVTSGGVYTALNAKQDKLTFATEEEAIGGTNNTALMTPLRVDQAFDEKFKVIDGVLNVFENGEWVEYEPK